MSGKELKKMKEPNEAQRKILEIVHKTLLEALRHREQEILRYIAILAPALVGFIWLIRFDSSCQDKSFVFIAGTAGVLLLLLIGAIYSLSLGYNFRQITFQLAKMESEPCLDISQYMLKGWPRRPEKFAKRYGRYCTPPEIIKVFWLAFILVIIGVTLSVFKLVFNNNSDVTMKKAGPLLIGWGLICCITSLLMPIYYGRKIKDCADKEPSWEKEEKS